MSNREIVQRYMNASMDQDWATIGELAHADIVVTYPQSGEIIRGSDNYAAMLSNYPGGLDHGELDIAETHRSKESVHVATSPMGLPIITVSGASNTFFCEGVVKYPDGGVFNFVGLIELLDGKVVKETSYFAPPFDPPAWRASFVEQ